MLEKGLRGEYMKITKRLLTIIISITLVFGGLYFATPKSTKADADFAITAPKNGSLKAAGYFDITWEDASQIKEVDSYDVFVDGSLVGNATDTKYEFYTTKVNYHKVWVRANFKDGTDHYTKTINFAITKKGLATEQGMGCYNINTKQLGIAWYYNWGRGSIAGHPMYRDLEYVPMIWGTQDDRTPANIRTKMLNAINKGYKYMLGFNEPDIKGDAGGCNMDTSTVISLWPSFMSYSGSIKVGSPAYGLWSKVTNSQFPTFMAGVENNVDFVCIHCYPNNYSGASMAKWFIRDVVQDTYDRYHKPIWITEYSTSGDNGVITQDNTAEFIRTFLPALDDLDYVERQSYFSFNSASFNGGLYNYSTGELSKSGEAYAECGNPTKYLVTGDEVNPRDSEEPTEEPFTEPQTTVAPTEKPTVAPTTAKPTVKPTTKKTTVVKKPKKVTIKSAKYKKKRKVYLKFKKVSGARGYQVRYSDEKNFDGYWTKNTKKTKITIKKLYKNTTYYFKARAYKIANGAKLYGSWSKKKKVRVKK